VKQSKPVAGPPHTFVSVVTNSTKPREANSRTNGSRIRISLNRTSINLGEAFRTWNAKTIWLLQQDLRLPHDETARVPRA
jgi:hypothetical protein